MAKNKWLMLWLVILVMAIAVPITIFAMSPETKISVDAKDLAGNKLTVDAKGGSTTFVGCIAMTGRVKFVTDSGAKTEIKGDLWSTVVGSSIEIHDDGLCGSFEVRINLLALPITVTTGATGSSVPSNVFTFNVDPVVKVKVETK